MVATVKQITRPLPCVRMGTQWTVRTDLIDHTGTVLHQLSNPDERPSFKVGGQWITVPDLKVFRLEAHKVFNALGEKTAEVVNLCDPLLALDVTIYNKMCSPGEQQITKNLGYLSRLIDDRVFHAQAENPGQFTVALGYHGLKEGEIGISSRMASSLVRSMIRNRDKGSKNAKKWIDFLLQRLDNPGLVEVFLSAPETCGDEVKRACIRDLSSALDGMRVWVIRYPNASRTSHRLATIRVIVGALADCIFIPTMDMVRKHQGDFDGDLLAYHIHSRQGKASPPAPLRWRQMLKTGDGLQISDIPDTLDAKKDPLAIMRGFGERSKWVGLLTYNFWVLTYSLSQRWKELGFESRQSTIWYVIDILTPLIEGVMNARKEGLTDSQTLANMVCEMFAGRLPWIDVMERLPMKEEGDPDEEAFSPSQRAFFTRAMQMLSDGKDKFAILDKVEDFLLLTACTRFNPESIKTDLGYLDQGASFYQQYLEAFRFERFTPIPQDWKEQQEMRRNRDNMSHEFDYADTPDY